MPRVSDLVFLSGSESGILISLDLNLVSDLSIPGSRIRILGIPKCADSVLKAMLEKTSKLCQR